MPPTSQKAHGFIPVLLRARANEKQKGIDNE
jgi:hypothetical protein